MQYVCNRKLFTSNQALAVLSQIITHAFEYTVYCCAAFASDINVVFMNISINAHNYEDIFHYYRFLNEIFC